MAVVSQTSSAIHSAEKTQSLYTTAAILAVVTIAYNLLEGVVSVAFGAGDETLALFGFGLDSFVEVLSGIGILHMVLRLRHNRQTPPDTFKQRALRCTGTAFYLLAAGLPITAIVSLIAGTVPETTLPGTVIALVSIVSMWLLIRAKVRVGTQLQSQAIIADAHCTRTCLYLSVVLLVASLGYELTGIGLLDTAGAFAVAIFAFREGREAFQKAKGISCCSCEGSCG